MSSNRYTMYLATNRDTSSKWSRIGAFAFRLVAPDGAESDFTLDDKEPVNWKDEDQNPAYTALSIAVPLLPRGSHLHVISSEQYLSGGPNYPGILNTTPAARHVTGYRNSKRKPIASAAQLKALDNLLGDKGITTSAAAPATGEERRVIGEMSGRASAVLSLANGRLNGLEPY